MTATPEREEFEAWAVERGHPLCDVIPKHGPASSGHETVLRFSDIAWEAWQAARQSAPESCAKVDDCTESLCMQANRCKHTLPPQPQRLCVEQSEDRWIPVSERLPYPQLFVQFWDGTWCYGMKENDDPESRQWFDFSCSDRDDSPRDTYTVTHWMPLPDAPAAAMKA